MAILRINKKYLHIIEKFMNISIEISRKYYLRDRLYLKLLNIGRRLMINFIAAHDVTVFIFNEDKRDKDKKKEKTRRNLLFKIALSSTRNTFCANLQLIYVLD